MLLKLIGGKPEMGVLPPRYRAKEKEELGLERPETLTPDELKDFVWFNPFARSRDVSLDVVVDMIMGQFDYMGLVIAPQKRAKYQSCVRLVVVNLLLARKIHPGKFVIYSRANNRYHDVPYKPFVRVIDAMHSLFLITGEKGYRDRTGKFSFSSRLSNMRATANMVKLIDIYDLKYNCIYFERTPIVVSKKINKQKVDTYPTTKRTKLLAKNINIINKQIQKSTITLVSISDKSVQSELEQYFVGDKDNNLYRRFSDDNCITHGRFYGHPAQALPRKYRKHLRIDGESIAYLDYGSCHTNMAYALNGLPPCEDAYDIGNKDIPREYIKVAQAVLMHNLGKSPARSIAGAVTKANKNKKPGEAKIPVKPGYARATYEGLLPRHNQILGFYGTAPAKQFMYYDSCLAEEILLRLMREGITCIPLHDGFFVAKSHKQRLREVMVDAYRCMFGQEPIIKDETIE